MMRPWDLVQSGSRFWLDNAGETPVRASKSVKASVLDLAQGMEDLQVPFAYTDGLEEVYLARHLPNKHGDYVGGVIRLVAGQPDLLRTFIHELAHYVDDCEEITDDGLLTLERKTRACHMVDPYSKHSDGEYLAVGFEVYYCGTIPERRKMKRENPLLFKTISRLHRRFRRL